jgi:hypothetical protein
VYIEVTQEDLDALNSLVGYAAHALGHVREINQCNMLLAKLRNSKFLDEKLHEFTDLLQSGRIQDAEALLVGLAPKYGTQGATDHPNITAMWWELDITKAELKAAGNTPPFCIPQDS